MKNRIRLTESQLHRVIKESVKKVLNEIGDTPKGQHALGAVAGRALYNTKNFDTYDNALNTAQKNSRRFPSQYGTDFFKGRLGQLDNMVQNNNVITDPYAIFDVLYYVKFKRAIVTQGNGEEFKVVVVDGVPEYYDEKQNGQVSHGWHTFYCPQLNDILKGMIKQVKIIE